MFICCTGPAFLRSLLVPPPCPHVYLVYKTSLLSIIPPPSPCLSSVRNLFTFAPPPLPCLFSVRNLFSLFFSFLFFFRSRLLLPPGYTKPVAFRSFRPPPDVYLVYETYLPSPPSPPPLHVCLVYETYFSSVLLPPTARLSSVRNLFTSDRFYPLPRGIYCTALVLLRSTPPVAPPPPPPPTMRCKLRPELAADAQQTA